MSHGSAKRTASGAPASCRRASVSLFGGTATGRAVAGLALEACASLCGRGQRRRMLISSRRCRSVRPPSVLEWAIPHWVRRRLALTVPIFGTASRRLRTRAVCSQAGGSARIGASSIVPAASCFFSVALALRISFACSSPRRRCSLDLAGTRALVRPVATQAILEPHQAARQARPPKRSGLLAQHPVCHRGLANAATNAALPSLAGGAAVRSGYPSRLRGRRRVRRRLRRVLCPGSVEAV